MASVWWSSLTVQRSAGSAGTYDWAGSWNTYFMVDPAKELIGIFMAQQEPSASRASPRPTGHSSARQSSTESVGLERLDRSPYLRRPFEVRRRRYYDVIHGYDRW